MFLDVVGIVIAFSTVMLLLSLMVAALGQATQATLRLRGKNLQRGLAMVLDTDLKDKNVGREVAANVLNYPDISTMNQVANPSSWIARIRGPATTWLDPELLRRAAAEYPPGDPKADDPSKKALEVISDKTVERFENYQKPMSERFTLAMRAVSMIWALVIAAVFQVSAPLLIQQLSTDPALRSKTEALAPLVLLHAEDTLTMIEEYQPVYKNALQEMAERYPEHADAFFAVDTETPYPLDVSQELSDLIDGAENQERILTELEELLTAKIEVHRESMFESALKSREHLSLIDITPFRFGQEFYFRDGGIQFGNILGILMTMILIMLGAPFWFNTLRAAVTFRDIFTTRGQRKDGSGSDAPQGGSS